MKDKSYVLIALAGIFWGSIGFFTNNLIAAGFTPEQAGFTRLLLGFLLLALYTYFKIPEALKLNKISFMYSLIIGALSQALFNISYFNAINKLGISLSAVLLYTSPIFVALFSKLIYKEKLDKAKIISLSLCFIGAFIGVTGGTLNFSSLNILGVLFGACSAITYALMPIISKSALKHCNRFTIIIYGFLFGAILMLPLAKPLEIISLASNPKTLLFMFGLGIFPASLAYICYVSGIATGIDLSKVGIISSIELVISALIGWTIFQEPFSIIKLMGLCIMMFSIVIVKREDTSTVNEVESA